MLPRRLRLALLLPTLMLAGCFGSDDRPVEVAAIGPSPWQTAGS